MSTTNPYSPPRGAARDFAPPEELELDGTTLAAKPLLEIKVLRSDGAPALLGRICRLRNSVNQWLGVTPLYALVDVLFVLSERRQCLRDLLADNIAVRA